MRVRRVATTIERSDDIRVERRRLNRCNELIDWRCLRDCHRYMPETRLHVRWLSVQRRPRVTVNRRPPPFLPNVPFSRATPFTRARAFPLRWQEERQVRRTVSVPNMFHSSRRLSLFAPRARPAARTHPCSNAPSRGCLFFSRCLAARIPHSRGNGALRGSEPLLPASVGTERARRNARN
jgi:hypothetical protein